ncbi:Hpt domain-containing protein [Candidatus Venteria ishoeyi]|uniref:Hpt domain-containing protein n=1 Tax=Candidatus Venteria ishoeyi TaxID=1899563 RepID=UPI0025A565C5|nr:Hpt domain-containing protein [Candidatus Venteria ishoeyi]MDM8545730.1 Hpt domain-containing protein [Candidatus Venteria ishoeyi]
MPLPLIELPDKAPMDEIDEDILEIFIEEAEEVLEEIHANYNVWKNSPADTDSLQTLRRAFHTLKGSGRLVGAFAIGELGWAFENMLNKLIDGSIERNAHMMAVLDQVESAIPRMVELFKNDDKSLPYDLHLLISQADHLVESKGAELGEFEPESAGAETLEEVETVAAEIMPDTAAETTPVIASSEAKVLEEVVDIEQQEAEENSILLQIFTDEATEHLNQLKAFIIHCHQGKGCQINDDIILVLHTINGSARSVGFMDMAALAAQMEAYARTNMEHHGHLDKEMVALLIDSGKMLENALHNHGKAADVEQHAQLLTAWSEQLENISAQFAQSAQLATTEMAATSVEDKQLIETASPVAAERSEELDEFMEIFLEEAEEILETCQSLLVRWQAAPDSLPLIKELQRELHTLKGGSRMVGIVAMGDLSHKLESVLTQIAEGRAQSSTILQSMVQESVDELANMLERKQNNEVLQPATNLIEQINAAVGGEDAPISRTPRMPSDTAKAAKTTKPQPNKAESGQEPGLIKTEKTTEDIPVEAEERVRVRASLIDKLTNLAGEMAISRAHMEQQQGAVKLNTGEMEETVMRLRDQLRRLEIETEAQIISHFGDVVVSKDTEEFDPLEMDRFSVLQQLSRSLMETVNDLQSIQENLTNMGRHNDSLLLQQGRIGAEMQDSIMRTRMVPFSQVSPRLQRIARLTSRELHKQVEFHINNDNIEFERTILNRIVAPLEHMLRNAIGHGIEDADKRRKTNKNAVAQVGIELEQEGAELILTLYDDGGGINLDAIRRKAEERGMLQAGEEIADEELMQFILQPAFSTAKSITQVSGRGVGMDIANSEIKQLGGTLIIHSKRGQGSRFEVRLPMSLTISQALLVHLGEETLAVPLHNIDAIMRVQRQEVHVSNNEERYYTYMGHDYRIAYLADLLKFPRASTDANLLPMLLVRSANQRIALLVDAIEGNREVVVKSVGAQLSGIRWIAGATILGDGRVVIILDVLTLLRSNIIAEATEIQEEKTATQKLPKKTIMVVDDSITVRKVTARLLKRQGMEVITAKDGLDAIAQLQDVTPDLMLLDVEMPRMDGFELATQMRNAENLKHIPIIMITSRTGQKHRERAAKIGINKHLGKPFNEPELLDNIRALLDEQKQVEMEMIASQN